MSKAPSLFSREGGLIGLTKSFINIHLPNRLRRKGSIFFMKNNIHNKKYLKDLRKDLRKTMTPAEAFLWNVLKENKFESRKFRRQHSIKNFIVDFYCAQERIIIELDGEVHLNPNSQENDRKREEILNEMGFKVLRFENKMVFDKLQSVLQEIRENFKN